MASGRLSTRIGKLLPLDRSFLQQKKPPAQPTARGLHRWQKCAICGQRHARTYKFEDLASHGIKGKYAAMECLGLLPSSDFPNVAFFTPLTCLKFLKER